MKRFAKIVNGYNYFRSISLSRSPIHEINNVVVTTEVVTLCKKLWSAREPGIYPWLYSNKLAYLQLIIVLVYENRPPKSHEKGHLN